MKDNQGYKLLVFILIGVTSIVFLSNPGLTGAATGVIVENPVTFVLLLFTIMLILILVYLRIK